MEKNLSAKQEVEVRSLDGEDLLQKKITTHSSILAWEIHGPGSLVSDSPWGCKESDMTELLNSSSICTSIEIVTDNIQEL